MTEGFYFDTSIWIDFHEKRGGNGKLALKLILKIINNNLKIAYSDLHIREFKNLNYTLDEINSILSIIKPKNSKRVHIYREQIKEATKLNRQRKIPKKDALHAILSRDNDLQLISRDRHFERLKDITIVKKPEDFI